MIEISSEIYKNFFGKHEDSEENSSEGEDEKNKSRGKEDNVESNDTNHNEIANINLEENKGFFI